MYMYIMFGRPWEGLGLGLRVRMVCNVSKMENNSLRTPTLNEQMLTQSPMYIGTRWHGPIDFHAFQVCHLLPEMVQTATVCVFIATDCVWLWGWVFQCFWQRWWAMNCKTYVREVHRFWSLVAEQGAPLDRCVRIYLDRTHKSWKGTNPIVLSDLWTGRLFLTLYIMSLRSGGLVRVLRTQTKPPNNVKTKQKRVEREVYNRSYQSKPSKGQSGAR